MKDTRDILMKKDPQYIELRSAGGKTDQSPGPLISRRGDRPVPWSPDQQEGGQTSPLVP